MFILPSLTKVGFAELNELPRGLILETIFNEEKNEK